MVTVLGIDEAGRGSVIGPLVMGGAMIDEKDLKKLEDIGVTDSKMIPPKRREQLYSMLKKLLKDFVVLKISAQDIDRLRGSGTNLNRIEAIKIAEIVKTMKAKKAYIDAPQVSTEKFKNIVLSLVKTNTELICENYADMKYVIVGAASILAKVERDREIEKIKKKVNFDFGVGYPHDERSIEFVKKSLRENKNLKYIRHSWVTVSDLKKAKEQRNLSNF